MRRLFRFGRCNRNLSYSSNPDSDQQRRNFCRHAHACCGKRPVKTNNRLSVKKYFQLKSQGVKEVLSQCSNITSLVTFFIQHTRRQFVCKYLENAKSKVTRKKNIGWIGLMHIIYLAKAIYIIILHNSSQVIFNIIISAFNGMDRHLLIQYFASENCPNKGHRIML